MFDAKRLLDTLVGGSQPGSRGGQGSLFDQALEALGGLGQSGAGETARNVLGQATSGVREVAARADQATGGVGQEINRALGDATGGASKQELVDKAKGFMDRNPGVAEAALIGAASLLLGTRGGRGLTGSLAGLGGLALVGGLAYKAFQNQQAGRPLIEGVGGGAQPPSAALPAPSREAFASATDDDALLYVRAMVAAASADGHIDAGERTRITSGLTQAGVDAEATRWLEAEMADPASVDALSEGVNTPEKGAQVYAAARVAVEPDTMQEREFLRQLATALDLNPNLVRQIDDTASGIKAAIA